jgi:hypothetical protein
MPSEQMIAQALVEHGLLDSLAAGLTVARDRLELYVGRGNGIYVGAAVLVIIVLLLARRRR